MDRKGLDNICEKGILGLVLAILVFSVLATGAVRTLEFLAVQFMTIAVGMLWLARFWLNPRQRLLFPPVGWAVKLPNKKFGHYLDCLDKKRHQLRVGGWPCSSSHS